MSQPFLVHGWLCVLLVTASLTLFSLCVLSDSWELTQIQSEAVATWLNKTEGGDGLMEIIKDRILIVTGGPGSVRETAWPHNKAVLASTRSGLWRTCLDVSLQEYREDLLPALPWVGARCVPHEVRHTASSSTPPWLRVMNISVSCCLTALIILSAALTMTVVGLWYRQATCLLVTSVLMLISVFFLTLSLALHWAHRHQRAAQSPSLLASGPAWSQYLGNVIMSNVQCQMSNVVISNVKC